MWGSHSPIRWPDALIIIIIILIITLLSNDQHYTAENSNKKMPAYLSASLSKTAHRASLVPSASFSLLVALLLGSRAVLCPLVIADLTYGMGLTWVVLVQQGKERVARKER